MAQTQPTPKSSANEINFSRFENKRDNAPKSVSMDWRQLCDRLKNRSFRNSKDGALFSGACYPEQVWRREHQVPDPQDPTKKLSFRDPHNPTPEDWRAPIRSNEFVEAVSLAILDFDGGATLDQIKSYIQRLNNGKGAAAVIYSTFSHTPDAPKFRVFIWLLVPVAASDWPEFWARLSHHFGDLCDGSAKDAARIHYTPSCPKSGEADAVYIELDGAPLDGATLPAIPKNAPEVSATTAPEIGGDAYARQVLKNECERLRATASDRNKTLNDKAINIGGYIGAGRLNRADAENELAAAMHANGYVEKDGLAAMRATMKSGLDAGLRTPNYQNLPTERTRPAKKSAPKISRDPHTDASEAKAQTPTPLPIIETSNRQLRDMSAETLGALKQANTPPRIFMRAAVPVRLGHDEHDRPVIERIGEGEMRHELTRAADFERTHAKGVSAVAPPLEIVRDILATPALPFPPLIGVVQAPTVRPDGSILDVPGYDSATRLLFAPQPGAAIPQVPHTPTAAQAKAARELILDLFADFPFAEPSSHAAAVALMLTLIARPAIAGPVPLAIADATQAGTGKGLLTNVIAVTATGHPAAVEHAPANDEEWDKRITATLREGPQLIALDDVNELKSPSLARALTASEWKGRVLGRSENVTLPQRAAWVATGNNIRLGGDIPRRCYWIRLDAQTSRPWEREGFKHPDLLKWTREHRAEIVVALLTLTRSWFAAGCPAPTVKPIGSFEDWTRIIGGILQHAEIFGFLDNLPALYSAADDEGPEWEAFLTVLHCEFESAEITVAQIHERAQSERGAALREVLPGALLDQIENAGRFRRSLGKSFAKYVGRRYGAENLHICRAADDSHAKVARWRVKSAGLAGFAGLVSAQREALQKNNSLNNSHGRGPKSTPLTPLTPQIDDSIFDDEPATNGYGND